MNMICFVRGLQNHMSSFNWGVSNLIFLLQQEDTEETPSFDLDLFEPMSGSIPLVLEWT